MENVSGNPPASQAHVELKDDVAPYDRDSVEQTQERRGSSAHLNASAGRADSRSSYREDSSSGLQLASVDPVPASEAMETSAVRAMPDIEARELAGFGAPGSGVIDAVKYWLRVRNRLKELDKEYDRSEEASREANIYLQEAMTVLGREGYQFGLSEAPLKPRYALALKAERDLKTTEDTKSNLETERQANLEKLQAERKGFEEEAAPLKEKEEKASRELSDIQSDYKRVETKLRQAEDEHEKTVDVIAKRQEEYFDPEKSESDKERLFSETTELEQKKEYLDERVLFHKQELSELAEPVSEAEANVNQLREKLSEKMARIQVLRRAETQMSRDYAEKADAAELKIGDRIVNVEQAWAQVGEAIFKNKFGKEELALPSKNVASATEAAASATRHIELLTRAKDCYDYDVVTKAKRISVVFGVAIGAIIAVGLYLLQL
ncbi:MAG: hypothetical protein GY847_15115 [Proteobacteria bacterium]|nr:hypothetical protein [Pseudomonadota bacterium]